MTEPNVSSDSSEGDLSPPASQGELPGHYQRPDISYLQQQRGAIGGQPIIEDVGPEEAPIPATLLASPNEGLAPVVNIVHEHHYHYNQQKTLHYNAGTVYKGFKGDVGGTKMDVKDSKIRSIGAPPQPSRPSSRRLLSELNAPPTRPELGWHRHEERSRRSARGSSRQPLIRPPVPSEEEEQSNENEDLGAVGGQEESIQSPILTSSPNTEEQPPSYETESFESSLGAEEGGWPSSTELNPQPQKELSIFSTKKKSRHRKERARGSSHQPLILPPVPRDEEEQSNEYEDLGAVGGQQKSIQSPILPSSPNAEMQPLSYGSFQSLLETAEGFSRNQPSMPPTISGRKRDRPETGRRREYLPIYDPYAGERETELAGRRSRRNPAQPREHPPRDDPESSFPDRPVRRLEKGFETRESAGYIVRQPRSPQEPRRLYEEKNSYLSGSPVQSPRVEREDRHETPQTAPSAITQLQEYRDEDESSSAFVEDTSLTIPKVLYGEPSQVVSGTGRQGRKAMLSKIESNSQSQIDNTDPDKNVTIHKHIQTGNYMRHMNTQTGPDLVIRASSLGLPFIDVHVQTDKNKLYDNDTQTNILQQTNTPTQTLVKVYQENDFQTEQLETVTTPSQTEIPDSHLAPVIQEAFRTLAQNSQQGGDSALALMNMFDKESKIEDAEQINNEILVPVIMGWRIIWQSIALKICAVYAADKNTLTASYANTLIVLLTDDLETGIFVSQFRRFSLPCKDVIQIGKYFRTAEKYVHSIAALYAAAKLNEYHNKGDQSSREIVICAQQIATIVKSLANQEPNIKIIKDHVIPLMHEVMKFHQSIQCSSRKVKVMAEAECLFHIGLCYSYCREYSKSAYINKTAIELMTSEWKDEVQTYKLYGLCIHNAGAAHEKMGKIKMADELYRMALRAYCNVRDWGDEGENESFIKCTKSNLKNLKYKSV
ncbi:uncharacterized protein LOC144427208 [Styela clava]